MIRENIRLFKYNRTKKFPIGLTIFYLDENHFLTNISSQGFQISTHELQEMGARLCEALLYLKVKDRTRSLPLYDIADGARR